MGDLDKKTLMESIKETLKEFFGEGKPAGQAGAKQFTEDDVTRIAAAAAEKATQPLTTKISELETKLSEAEKRDGQKSAADLAEGAVAKLKADGKWLPAFDAMGAPQIFAELAQSEKKITFGEADKKTEKSPLQVFADFLAGLPQIVPAGEIAKGASSAKKGGRVIPFTETKGVELDQDSIAFNEAAETRAKEKSIDLGAAMRELRSEGWKPAAGSAAAGAV